MSYRLPCLRPVSAFRRPAAGERSSQSFHSPSLSFHLWLSLSSAQPRAALACAGESLGGLLLPSTLTAQEITPTSTPSPGSSPVPSLVPSPTPEVVLDPVDVQIEEILQNMSVADRVGQLFVVTFQGRKTGSTSEIAELIRDYRIGGVVMSGENGNFSNADGVDTPRQVAILANQLQAMVHRIYLTPDEALNPAPDRLVPPAPSQFSVSGAGVGVPLLVGIQQSGDDLPGTSLRQGFTPLPSQMALGATWNPDLARSMGQIVGTELQAVGINLLLGPTLDVLEQPRRDSVGGLGLFTFGSDAYWVGEMGQAYIQGIHTGSGGQIATIANHFPGQGGSDRRPDEEVATIQKSLQELRRIELPPFAGVTQSPSSILSPQGNPASTDGLMSSHIRYSGFQGSRERTPPISMATELGTILALDEFSGWREAGGIVMSDQLGLPAVRLYYDPTLQTFPKQRIALDAFLAGNDLLYLSRFGLTDRWEDERSNIKETISFFRERYATDPDFAAGVDAAVRRILRLKLGIYRDSAASQVIASAQDGADLYAGTIALDRVLVSEEDLVSLNGVARTARLTTVGQVARESITVLYPDPQGLSDPLPAPPQPGERMVIFSASRPERECGTCQIESAIAPDGLEEIMLRLYGPGATGQMDAEQVRSFTFEDLNQVLNDSAAPQLAQVVETELAEADWLIFAMLDVDLERYPNSDAVKQFLRLRSDRLRGKRIVVLAFNAPYFLDATEISKLTAYFGVYGRTQPFLENAVRALFRAYPATGAPPVSVPGTRFNNLIERMEPNPNQVINLQLAGESLPAPLEDGSAAGTVDLSVGDAIRVQAGPVLDLNGHRVPDGTPVTFRLIYEGEELALPTEPIATVDGVAAVTVPLDRSGTLRISASSGQATTSISILVSIQGENSATIATVVPTPTAVPVPTATPTAAEGEANGDLPGGSGDQAEVPRTVNRVDLTTLAVALSTMMVMVSLMLVVLLRVMPRHMLMFRMLWATIAGLVAYLLYGLGWIPGASQLQAALNPWAVAPVVFVAMLITLVWMQLVQEQ